MYNWNWHRSWLKRTHLGVFVEESGEYALQVTTALQQHVATDRLTVVEVVVLRHGSVEGVGQQTAAQSQPLSGHRSIVRHDLQLYITGVVHHSSNSCVRNATTNQWPLIIIDHCLTEAQAGMGSRQFCRGRGRGEARQQCS